MIQNNFILGPLNSEDVQFSSADDLTQSYSEDFISIPEVNRFKNPESGNQQQNPNDDEDFDSYVAPLAPVLGSPSSSPSSHTYPTTPCPCKLVQTTQATSSLKILTHKFA